MIFAILTLLAALALAAVAGWFSIIGVMTIYAGAPFHALVMGVTLEAGKLVTTSWLYRNWKTAGWGLKMPLIVFTVLLMLATSIGVYGFLSKSHLEQGAGTMNNSARVETIEQQIVREQSVITSAEKTMSQLDATLDSYLGKDRADRSVVISKRQEPQRKELRNTITETQKRIDVLNNEKFTLQSELRKLQLEVGPIRYIAELIYGAEGDADKKIEAAVRIFTLLIVSTLDPLAVVLLIAANHTLLRYKSPVEGAIISKEIVPDKIPEQPAAVPNKELASVEKPAEDNLVEVQEYSPPAADAIEPVTEHELSSTADIVETNAGELLKAPSMHSAIYSPRPSRVIDSKDTMTKPPWMHQNDVLGELIGNAPHLSPEQISKDEISNVVNKSPKVLNWLDEFKRS